MSDKSPALRCAIKEYRRRKGWSQDELARLAGIRRQAVYDMESGRYLPNTAVALRLARALDCTVEMLFVENAPAESGYLHLLGDKAVDCLLPRAKLADRVLVLGCDPALSVLSGLIANTAPQIRAHCGFASSRWALLAVNEGQAHVAGTHYHSFGPSEGNLEALRSLSPDLACLMIAFSAQEEGFMVAPGNPLGVRSVEDIAGTRFVNREEGAALRKLLDSKLSRQGVPVSAIKGYSDEVRSHFEGAVRVAGGDADSALGLRIVAESFGLDFVPLAVTRCDLVIPIDLREHPGITVLLDLLQSSYLRKELNSLPGYDASEAGKVILG